MADDLRKENMAVKEKIFRYLQGALELALFMRGGIEFFSNDRKAALWSFLAPLLCIPAVLLYAVTEKPDDFAHLSSSEICVAYTVKAVASVAVFLGAVWFFSGWMGKRENYWRFVAAGNWVSLVMLAVMAPFLIFDAQGWAAGNSVHAMIVIVAIYGYAVTGYIATRAFSIPWMLGGAIGIFELFVSKTLHDVMKAYYA